MSQRIQSVVIVGGGTAGWLTAGIIAARHQAGMKAGSFSVTLIESPDIRIIGVGEGTWPSMRAILEKIGVSATDLFRNCEAAFKQGGRFAGWTTGTADDQSPWFFDEFDRLKEVFLAASIQYVLYGMGFATEVAPEDTLDTESLASRLRQENERPRLDLRTRLPKSRDLANKIHEYGLQSI
jgi:tryptophan 7-halogenase